MNGLKKAGITLNRKMLSEIAIAETQQLSRHLSREGKGFCIIKVFWCVRNSSGRTFFRVIVANVSVFSLCKIAFAEISRVP